MPEHKISFKSTEGLADSVNVKYNGYPEDSLPPCSIERASALWELDHDSIQTLINAPHLKWETTISRDHAYEKITAAESDSAEPPAPWSNGSQKGIPYPVYVLNTDFHDGLTRCAGFGVWNQPAMAKFTSNSQAQLYGCSARTISTGGHKYNVENSDGTCSTMVISRNLNECTADAPKVHVRNRLAKHKIWKYPGEVEKNSKNHEDDNEEDHEDDDG